MNKTLLKALNAFSLTYKVLLGALLAGTVTWFALDYLQTHQLKDIFSADLSNRLENQAFQDRLRFDHVLKDTVTNITITSKYLDVLSHISALRQQHSDWNTDNISVTPITKQNPDWIPELPRTVDAVLVLDGLGRTREIWFKRKIDLPEKIVKPTELLLRRGSYQSELSEDHNLLYINTVAPLHDDQGATYAYIMYVSHIDNIFMLKLHGVSNQIDTILAFITEDPARVLISDDPVRIPNETLLKDLEKKYLIIGKTFLDYGKSEIRSGLATFVPREKFSSLIDPVTGLGRQQRALTAVIITVVFFILTLVLVRRIQKLSGKVSKFTAIHFEAAPQTVKRNDEIAQLDHLFIRLTEEVLRSRNALQDEAERLRQEVDERKSIEEKLVYEKTISEAANRTKSEFLANMSHELRTPLNAIIGFSGAMKTQIFGPLNKKYIEYLSDIMSSGDLLLELINDILDVAAIESGKLELHISNFDINKTISESARLIQHRADKGSVELHVDIEEGLPQIHADARRVKQILLNLMSNAVKFTPPQGTVTVHAVLQNQNAFVLTVTDTGIGMDSDELEKAMMQFGQVNRGHIGKHEGTGLGLPLTKALIELHGGSMTLNSKKGVGTTVTVVFPRNCLDLRVR